MHNLDIVWGLEAIEGNFVIVSKGIEKVWPVVCFLVLRTKALFLDVLGTKV